MESIREVQYTLDRSPVHYGVNSERQTYVLTFTPKASLELIINLNVHPCMVEGS